MTASIAEICDAGYPLNDAIQRALVAAKAAPGFELELSKFLQAQCMEKRVDLPTVFRGLEVLGGILDESRLVPLLRPFLRSRDSKIASKSVLILGRQAGSLSWLTSIRTESDDRIRANLVESLWTRQDPEVEQVLKSALRDPHHRVVANAVYGLYLLGSPSWLVGLDHLLGSSRAVARRSGIWVIRSTQGPAVIARLKPLIRDSDPSVRHAAFGALVMLRENAAKRAGEPGVKVRPEVDRPEDERPEDDPTDDAQPQAGVLDEAPRLQISAESDARDGAALSD